MAEQDARHGFGHLDEEHRIIEDLVGILAGRVAGDTLAPADLDGIEVALDALGACMDGLHVLKEERVLFPLLQTRGLPKDHAVVNALLAQHESCRAYLRRFRDLCPAARLGDREVVRQLRADVQEFVGLVREHIRIEDGYFYEIAARHLQPADGEWLAARFAQVDATVDGDAIRTAGRLAASRARRNPPGISAH